MRPNPLNDVVLIGKFSRFLLRVNCLTVHRDLKDTPGGRNDSKLINVMFKFP